MVAQVAKCQIPDFDPEKHVYSIGGKKVPGVSEILKTIGITRDYSGTDTFYRDRGIACHKAIELYVGDDLDETTLDPICLPYLEGFKRWWSVRQQKSRPQTEVMLYSEKYGFAGTMDLLMDSKIIDYKCSKDPDKAFELQGLMYQWLVFENYGQYMPFMVLQLPGDGAFIELHQSVREWDLLEAIIRLYAWKKKRVQRV